MARRSGCSAAGSEGESHYIWAGFDAMRVLNRAHNDTPGARVAPDERVRRAASWRRQGAGVLLLESEESARERGARIYGEVAGAGINCGGHRQGGSMTAPNPNAVRRCIGQALDAAGIGPADVGAINGHLTATGADPKRGGLLGRRPRLRPRDRCRRSRARSR